MPKQKTKINPFQLILGILLNILVLVVAFIIYHEVFRDDEDGLKENLPNPTELEEEVTAP